MYSRRELLRNGALLTAGLAAYPFEPLAAATEPLERRASGQRVLILGAGLAGLVAALELHEAGHDVLVLEAQMRAGGRVQTFREPFTDGLFCDVGASEVPASHDHVMKWVERFGLEVKPWLEPRLATLAAVFHLNGQRLRSDAGTPLPLELTEEERKLGNLGMIMRYFADATAEIGDPKASGWPSEALAKYDDVTVAEMIRGLGASEGALKALKVQFFLDLPADGVEETSALYLLRDALLTPGGTEILKIVGGMDRLPKAFAARLADRIRYGARAVRVEHDESGVEVAFEQAGRLERVRGDRLICAVPFSLLRFVEISPALSEAKTRAIHRLPYAANTRVFLQTETRFWIEQGMSGFGYTDLPIKYVFDSTSDPESRRGLLEVYTSGLEARRFDPMSDPARIDFALDQVAKLFPEIREQFEGGAVKCWDEDPFARGAYAYFRPGQVRELLPHVAPAEGRIHFAGEHASSYPHWMQGALESGARAAREVNSALEARAT